MVEKGVEAKTALESTLAAINFRIDLNDRVAGRRLRFYLLGSGASFFQTER